MEFQPPVVGRSAHCDHLELRGQECVARKYPTRHYTTATNLNHAFHVIYAKF